MEIRSVLVTPFQTNCYIIEDAGEILVIDPGDYSSSLADAAGLAGNPSGATVTTVVDTHCHCDHCGGNARLIDRTGAELAIHAGDLSLLRGTEQQGLMFGVPVAPSPEPARFLEEGDTVAVGSTSLEVLHVPGHSPGHIALKGDGFIFSGDVLFAGSIGRTDLPGGDHAQLLESIRTRMLPLPDDTVVYCGHGPSTTIGEERTSNPFLVGL